MRVTHSLRIITSAIASPLLSATSSNSAPSENGSGTLVAAAAQVAGALASSSTDDETATHGIETSLHAATHRLRRAPNSVSAFGVVRQAFFVFPMNIALDAEVDFMASRPAGFCSCCTHFFDQLGGGIGIDLRRQQTRKPGGDGGIGGMTLTGQRQASHTRLTRDLRHPRQ